MRIGRVASATEPPNYHAVSIEWIYDLMMLKDAAYLEVIRYIVVLPSWSTIKWGVAGFGLV